MIVIVTFSRLTTYFVQSWEAQLCKDLSYFYLAVNVFIHNFYAIDFISKKFVTTTKQLISNYYANIMTRRIIGTLTQYYSLVNIFCR
jgi:hypothetical protein